MKAQWLLIPSLAFALCACEQANKPANTTTAPDNTGINVRDRDSSLPTSGNQSESSADLEITQKVRRAIVTDSSFSSNAKNIKIITQNGVVTLRGPVANDREKALIEDKVKNVAGVTSVNNLLEIAP